MAKVAVKKDEHWVWSADDVDPRHAHGAVLEVDATTARRWRRATREWERMNDEIAALMEPDDSDLEARTAERDAAHESYLDSKVGGSY